MSTPKLKVADGSVVEFDVLTWDEGWEFGHPTCVLRPIIRFSPNGDSALQLIEAVCEDACYSGFLKDEGDEGGIIDRQYPLKALKRRWGQNRGGKEFPRLQYTARRIRARFFLNSEGELEYEVTESGSLPSEDETT